MPILEVEIVTPELNSDLPSDLTQSLADAAAQVFGAAKGTVWVKLRIIPSAHYAEDGGKPEGVYPVFVTVLKSRIPEGSEQQAEVATLTNAIASILKRPEANVHVFYQPDAAGRAAFGGKPVH